MNRQIACGQAKAEMEDILGRDFYIALVMSVSNRQGPKAKPQHNTTPRRIVWVQTPKPKIETLIPRQKCIVLRINSQESTACVGVLHITLTYVASFLLLNTLRAVALGQPGREVARSPTAPLLVAFLQKELSGPGVIAVLRQLPPESVR